MTAVSLCIIVVILIITRWEDLLFLRRFFYTVGTLLFAFADPGEKLSVFNGSLPNPNDSIWMLLILFIPSLSPISFFHAAFSCSPPVGSGWCHVSDHQHSGTEEHTQIRRQMSDHFVLDTFSQSNIWLSSALINSEENHTVTLHCSNICLLWSPQLLFFFYSQKVGNLFGSHRSTIITVYNGAFDSSSAIFLFIKVRNSHFILSIVKNYKMLLH